jgi:hypothetical protein
LSLVQYIDVTSSYSFRSLFFVAVSISRADVFTLSSGETLEVSIVDQNDSVVDTGVKKHTNTLLLEFHTLFKPLEVDFPLK